MSGSDSVAPSFGNASAPLSSLFVEWLTTNGSGLSLNTAAAAVTSAEAPPSGGVASGFSERWNNDSAGISVVVNNAFGAAGASVDFVVIAGVAAGWFALRLRLLVLLLLLLYRRLTNSSNFAGDTVASGCADAAAPKAKLGTERIIFH